ncbi:MAG TPA: hypothetical protein VFN76_09975 [Candidatus Limnocylindria bacterium]|nr:hypothetical protein [Candidatus Limnocylindria bacterium]
MPGPYAPRETAIPTCWVRDAHTPDPFLINASDFDPSQHTRVDEHGQPLLVDALDAALATASVPVTRIDVTVDASGAASATVSPSASAPRRRRGDAAAPPPSGG